MQANREDDPKKLNVIKQNICETMQKQECFLYGFEKVLTEPS
jgi:hypothetical protein